jgi:hypothetical protein
MRLTLRAVRTKLLQNFLIHFPRKTPARIDAAEGNEVCLEQRLDIVEKVRGWAPQNEAWLFVKLFHWALRHRVCRWVLLMILQLFRQSFLSVEKTGTHRGYLGPRSRLSNWVESPLPAGLIEEVNELMQG